jgi:hypothetical protein
MRNFLNEIKRLQPVKQKYQEKGDFGCLILKGQNESYVMNSSIYHFPLLPVYKSLI